MSSTKQDYRNNKKNNKSDRKQQQKSKSFKNSSVENKDIPEGMYNTSMKPTSDELSYVYHEKEEKTYSNDCSDLLGINKSNEEDIKKEDIKKEIGSALPLDKPMKMQIRGRDVVAGLPKTIELNSTDVTEAISERLDDIILAVKAVLEQTPPELSSDIIDRGMIMTGGGSLLRNIDKLMTKVTGVPSYVAEEPLLCDAKGTGIALENLDDYMRSVISNR